MSCFYLAHGYLQCHSFQLSFLLIGKIHDDVIKWKHLPRHWPFVLVIHRWPANSPHKGQWRGVLMFSLICAWINGWVNSGEAGGLWCHSGHYDVTVMIRWHAGFAKTTAVSYVKHQLSMIQLFPYNMATSHIGHDTIIFYGVKNKLKA